VERGTGQTASRNEKIGIPTRRKTKKIIRKILVLFGIGILAFIGLLFVLWLFSPDVNIWKKQNPSKTVMMRYREEQYLKKTGKRLWRNQTWISLSQISPALIDAVLIAEDDKFFQHGGFDFGGMKEAFEKNIETGHIVGGGSTITQQLAKNLYLKPTQNPIRKIREAVIAFELNRKLKKRRILELYLNVIEWGRGIYGAEAAAQTYYQKSASELTAEEAIRLASVLPNPIRYQPEDDASRRMREKRRIVAAIMVKRELMTEEEYQLLLSDLDQAVH
jgi:monofunctional biosynthetic peptidoglycan transglycosylase